MKVFLKASSRVESSVEYARKLARPHHVSTSERPLLE